MQFRYANPLNFPIFLGLGLGCFVLPAYAANCHLQKVYIRATSECYQLEKQGRLRPDEDASACQIGRFRRYAGSAGTSAAYMECLNELGWLGLPPLSKPIWLK